MDNQNLLQRINSLESEIIDLKKQIAVLATFAKYDHLFSRSSLLAMNLPGGSAGLTHAVDVDHLLARDLIPDALTTEKLTDILQKALRGG